MDIGTIDYWANGWDSFLHRASAAAKLLAAAAIVGAIVITTDVFVLLGIYLGVAAAIVATRLPARPIFALSAYPAIFAVLFAIARWDGTLLTPAIILLRAVTAALAMLMVITTTSYPDVLAPFLRALPGPVGDAFLLTYRSLFLLLDLLGRLGTALRLRGGLRWRAPGRSIRNLASGLGLVLIQSLALGERTWAVLRLRGYRGRLAAGDRWRRLSAADLAPLGLALVLVGFALARRLGGAAVAEYNGYFLLLSLLGLLGATAYARIGRR